MPKLSELIAKAEAWAGKKISERFPKLKKQWKTILPLFLFGLYFYGIDIARLVPGQSA